MVAKKEKEYKFTYVFMHMNKCVCVCVCTPCKAVSILFPHFTDGNTESEVRNLTSQVTVCTPSMFSP